MPEEKNDLLFRRIQIPSIVTKPVNDVVINEKVTNTEEGLFSLENLFQEGRSSEQKGGKKKRKKKRWKKPNLVEGWSGTADLWGGHATNHATRIRSHMGEEKLGQSKTQGPMGQHTPRLAAGLNANMPNNGSVSAKKLTPSTTRNPNTHHRVKPPFRRLTPDEIAQRKADVLCIRCDEKWHNRHLCPRKELQVLVIQEDGSEREWEGDDDKKMRVMCRSLSWWR